MKSLTLFLTLVAGALAAGCARDCSSQVEQRCKTARLDEAACQHLADRAAKVPAQACEAILRAMETRGEAQ